MPPPPHGPSPRAATPTPSPTPKGPSPSLAPPGSSSPPVHPPPPPQVPARRPGGERPLGLSHTQAWEGRGRHGRERLRRGAGRGCRAPARPDGGARAKACGACRAARARDEVGPPRRVRATSEGRARAGPGRGGAWGGAGRWFQSCAGVARTRWPGPGAPRWRSSRPRLLLARSRRGEGGVRGGGGARVAAAAAAPRP